MITCEYPPQIGGIADYARQVAEALSHRGLQVSVWAPGRQDDECVQNGLIIKRLCGIFSIADLVRMNRHWRVMDRHKCIMLQWTPTGYGYKSVNLPFCLWLAWRTIR